MGGFVSSFFSGFEKTISGISGRRNHEGSPFRHALNLVPAAVGIATGNPWLAGATGAGVGAMNGGIKGALAGGLTSGIGAYLGNAAAFRTAQSLPALALGKSAYVGAMTGIGAQLGSSLGQGQTIGSVPAPNGAPINIPSFEQLRQNAVIKTQEAFEKEGIYRMLNPFRRFNGNIGPADRKKFPSLKKTAKERARRANV